MPAPRPRAESFRYDGFDLDPASGRLRLRYSSGDFQFEECFRFGSGDRPLEESPALLEAARVLFLLAGVSYYKTTAAPLIDLGPILTTAGERAFLTRYYVNGLAEFAYRNDIDLSDVRIIGNDETSPTPSSYRAEPGRPLIPFGGGIDSIVTVESIRVGADPALCIVSPPGEHFDAIERPAAQTGLPIVRIERELDGQVRRSAELGFFNGHVPVTAVITAAAVVAAVWEGRDAVVLSNEWSASVPTVVVDGKPINHQWSKGNEFERGFAELLQHRLGDGLAVFSFLRPRSELWVAQRFATMATFHDSFRSCNRAFHIDPAQRLDHWCGECDKCCFIDLILAPFIEATALSSIFDGREPLTRPENRNRFATLLGLVPNAKPFECVGDVSESRAAIVLAASRPDRRDHAMVQEMARDVRKHDSVPTESLLTPMGAHYIPERYGSPDLLVRSR